MLLKIARDLMSKGKTYLILILILTIIALTSFPVSTRAQNPFIDRAPDTGDDNGGFPPPDALPKDKSLPFPDPRAKIDDKAARAAEDALKKGDQSRERCERMGEIDGEKVIKNNRTGELVRAAKWPRECEIKGEDSPEIDGGEDLR